MTQPPSVFLLQDPPELLNFLMCNWSLPQNTVHLLVEILLNIFRGCQEIDCPGTHWGRNQDKTGPRKFNPLQMAFSSFTACIFNITFWPKKKGDLCLQQAVVILYSVVRTEAELLCNKRPYRLQFSF